MAKTTTTENHILVPQVNNTKQVHYYLPQLFPVYQKLEIENALAKKYLHNVDIGQNTKQQQGNYPKAFLSIEMDFSI